MRAQGAIAGILLPGALIYSPKTASYGFPALVPSRTPLGSALLCQEPPGGSWAAPGGTAPTATRSVCSSECSLRRRPGSLSARNTQEETQAPRGKTTCPRLLHVPGSAANLRASVQASARSRPRSPLGFAPLESWGNGSRSLWCPSSTLPHPCSKGKMLPGAAHPGGCAPLHFRNNLVATQGGRRLPRRSSSSFSAL